MSNNQKELILLEDLGLFITAIEAAKVYDKYILDNNLEHTKNF